MNPIYLFLCLFFPTGEKPDRDSGGDRIDVDPECDPREDHDQDRRDVNLNEEETNIPPQLKLDLQAWKRPYNNKI